MHAAEIGRVIEYERKHPEAIAEYRADIEAILKNGTIHAAFKPEIDSRFMAKGSGAIAAIERENGENHFVVSDATRTSPFSASARKVLAAMAIEDYLHPVKPVSSGSLLPGEITKQIKEGTTAGEVYNAAQLEATHDAAIQNKAIYREHDLGIAKLLGGSADDIAAVQNALRTFCIAEKRYHVNTIANDSSPVPYADRIESLNGATLPDARAKAPGGHSR